MNDTESTIATYEQRWQECAPTLRELQRVAIAAGDDRSLLLELVCVDLELRTRERPSGSHAPPTRLETYLKWIPRIGNIGSLPLELIAQEYRCRRRWGDRPDHAEYLARFVGRGGELRKRLEQVDRELSFEYGDSQPLEPLPGAAIDFSKLVLRRLLGGGGMGRIYAGTLNTGRPVAVKILAKRLAREGGASQRFREEIDLLGRLDHPQIVRLIGWGRLPNGGFYLVTPLYDRGDLAHAGPPGDWRRAVTIIGQLCDPLEYLHQQNTFHCDLKPSNVLLSEEGKPMLIDFGWAHDGEQATSRAGGTAAFLAPEQTVRGEHPNAATDVYGLGAILYWLLTGSPVHQGESLDAILENISRGRELVWPTNATAPQPLRSLCGRCLLANRDERIQAVSDVRAELNSLE